MIRIILGALMAAFGLLLLSVNDVILMLVFLVPGILLIYTGVRARTRRKEEQAAAQAFAEELEAMGEPAKTFTFRGTGTTRKCKFGSGTRDGALALSKVGDVCEFRQYEWEGKPAFAIINSRTGDEIAVVPAKDVDKVQNLLANYKAVTLIKNIDVFEWHNDMYHGCEIEMRCYEQEVSA